MSRQIVIDASAVIATLLRENSAAAILEATAGAELISPASLPYEVTNALSGRMRRSAADPQRLAPAHAGQAWTLFMRADITLYPVDNARHASALAIAGAQGIYCYDAYLIALALAKDAPLLTLDKGQQRTAAAMGVQIVSLEG
ncbi:MAG: type II toxin-antitoxin system VapC family toxin [Betaproteobacteria bacterium]|nr:type II toxin-antitoxin system VapC family toxin [Betaproteobacteria bacterium]MCL2886614.1 type II toxin-antitoxin system VapC family toxin [Betaproteobacteria bacterium]